MSGPQCVLMQQYFVPKPVNVPCTIYEDFQDGYSAFVRVMKVDYCVHGNTTMYTQ